MNKHLQHYFIAQSFLSRLPVPATEMYSDKQIGRSSLYYPFVGLVIGLILGLISWSLSFAEPLLVASIIITIWTIITGALHLDGLADTADAWLGGHGDKNRIFTIMKDPRSGTAGVCSIVLLLLLKVSALATLIEHAEWMIIILIPVIARLGASSLVFFLPSAKNEGLAYMVKNNLPISDSAFFLIVISVVLLFLSPLTLLFATIITFLLKKLMLKQIGGMTGDTLGASVEIIEATGLVFTALLI